ncbi:type I methionyl aminopeptidase [Anoxybacter fermentans]|uniref:Methionine aminopeptidase n=1 Tax=Anoxybacter fermentans TaxID=1323375 RepID=A0A3S9T2G6_9FIRM|nr:type I methionyl aminopeptidase [Anoxybacter fermentans]AZR74738.1 type I methionyl aminopeptidase [Anoxybacter fermentans]
MIVIKSEREIWLMREVGRIVAETHALLAEIIKPGITTAEIDRIAEEYILKCGAKPAFKGYQGFPATVCVAINEEVVHGIPGKRRLEEGDIIGLDIGAYKNGYYSDAARTLPVGKVSPEAKKLIEVTKESLDRGIVQAIAGNRLTDISHAIQSYAESHGFSVVRQYVGHGIGRKMHEAPQVPNYGQPGRGPRLKKGMTFAIEPMINAGGYEVKVLSDGWTVVTADGSLSAHFEDTIAITDEKPLILTRL